jgi:hypothetical protein
MRNEEDRRRQKSGAVVEGVRMETSVAIADKTKDHLNGMIAPNEMNG